MARLVLGIAMVGLVMIRIAVDGLPLLERGIEALGLAAAAIAASSFAPGDPPRRPWILRTLGIALVLVAHLVDPLQARGDDPRIAHVILIAANILGAAAMLHFARVIRASGLVAPPTGAGRLILTIVRIGAGIALALCVATVLIEAEASPFGLVRGLTLIISACGDAIVFIVAAGLVRALMPMRDGAAAQPYLLLAVDGLFFLLIDLAIAGGPPPAIAPVMPILSAIAGSAGLLAALAQTWLVRRR